MNRYRGLVKLAWFIKKSKGQTWHDYSQLSGLDAWQLPDQNALEKYVAWRTKPKGMPYDPLSADPRFGGYRLQAGVNTWKDLMSERKANGNDIDFYPFVYGGFQHQRANAARYGMDMSGMDDDRMMADARKVADLLASQRKAYLANLQAQNTLVASNP